MRRRGGQGQRRGFGGPGSGGQTSGPTPVIYMDPAKNITLGTTMRAIGTTPPVVLLAAGTGSLTFATGAPGIRVDILVGGLTFDLSFDNGATAAFSAQVIPVGGGDYTIPSGPFAGMILTFPLGTYNADTFYHGVVQTWVSSVGSASFTNATAAQQPIYHTATVDGDPSLQFGTGTNERLVNTDAAVFGVFTNNRPYTLFYKVDYDVVDAVDTVYSVGDSALAASRKRRFGKTSTGAGRHITVSVNDASSTITTDGVNPVPTLNPEVCEWFSPGTTVTLLVDGAATDIAAAAHDPGTLTPNQSAIGIIIDSTPDSPLSGHVGRLVLFGSELSAANRTIWRAIVENA